jgi:hypothetical protein
VKELTGLGGYSIGPGETEVAASNFNEAIQISRGSAREERSPGENSGQELYMSQLKAVRVAA